MLWLKNKFSLSDKGTIDLALAIIATAFQDFALMLPVGLIYSFIMLLAVLNIGGANISDSRSVFYLGAIFICALLIFASSWFQYNATFSGVYKESCTRRINLAERLRKISLSFFARKNLEELNSSIVKDCANFEVSCSHFIVPLAGAVIFLIFMSLPLIYINYRMAFAALWVVPLAFVFAYLPAKFQKEARTEKSELFTSIFTSGSYLILKLGIISTVLTGAILYSQNDLSTSNFILFIMTVSRLYDPLEIALQNLSAIITASPENEKVNEIMLQEIQTGSEKENFNVKNCDIEFKNVNLSPENFIIKHGEITILNGSGNLTAVRLLIGFEDISHGEITIGSENINKIIPENLMSLFSIIFQDVTLLNTSVMENIRLGRKSASDKDVMKAAEFANCDEFISKLPDGYKTLIGDKGYKLSSGERQKISIARALLKNSDIILLDESIITDSKIKESILKLIANKTVIVIASEKNSIIQADKIITLDVKNS